MPTFNVEIVDDRIMVEATLSVPPDGPKSDPFTALVDTGAQATMISEKVANALGAASVGKRNIVSLGGEGSSKPTHRMGPDLASTTRSKGPSEYGTRSAITEKAGRGVLCFPSTCVAPAPDHSGIGGGMRRDLVDQRVDTG